MMPPLLKAPTLTSGFTVNSPAQVLFASLIGTTIEFFDFYIYATAAVLVFPKLFFPSADASTGLLQSFATFALAFIARPLGSALFGHFGDRRGRKATLVAALLTMGISTVLIGLLPTYSSIGVFAPLLLALCRFGQGLGLGGEWGGAVLLATENAPPHKRAWYGMFPQLGAPLGFLCSAGLFLGLGHVLTDAQFLSFGWRIPFIGSSLLVLVGLYVRLTLTETPEFQKLIESKQQVDIPLKQVLTRHYKPVILGTLIAMINFVIFYLMTVFTLGYATTTLHYSRSDFLLLQMGGVLFFGLGIPVSAYFADRFNIRLILVIATVATILFGLNFASLFTAGQPLQTLVFLALGLGLMGLMYGPIGTALAGLFPTAVRYTGSSLAFNLAGILGASLAPTIATSLAQHYGIAAVGYYLSVAALVSLAALWIYKPEQIA